MNDGAPPRPKRPAKLQARLDEAAENFLELDDVFRDLRDAYASCGAEPPLNLRTFCGRLSYLTWELMNLTPEGGTPAPTIVFINEDPPLRQDPLIKIARLRRVWCDERRRHVFESVPIHLKLLVERIETKLDLGEVRGSIKFSWADLPEVPGFIEVDS